MKHIHIYFFCLFLVGCGFKPKNRISDEKIFYLAKTDNFQNLISDFYDINLKPIHKDSVYKYSDIYFEQPYWSKNRDSILIVLRNKEAGDSEFLKNLSFYSTFKNYSDSIFIDRSDVNCENISELINHLEYTDKNNRFETHEAGIDAVNMSYVYNIIKKCGFPSDKKHAFIVWLVIHHSHPIILEKYFKIIEDAVKYGKLDESLPH